jgi:hypothetical protein
MSNQSEKESSGHTKNALIAGIFTLLGACLGGIFLIANTLVNNRITFTSENNSTAVIITATSPSVPVSEPTDISDCLPTDFIPAAGGSHPPIDTVICIPTGAVAWISSDAATISILESYNKPFYTGFTFTLFGPVKFMISGVESDKVRLDVRGDASLLGTFDGKLTNLVYINNKVCDYSDFTGSACP